MPPSSASFRRALRQGLEPDGNLRESLKGFEDYRLRSKADAKVVVDALCLAQDESTFIKMAWLLDERIEVNTRAHEELMQEGARKLVHAFDAKKDNGDEHGEYLMQIIRVLAKYGGREGAHRVIEAARSSWKIKPGMLWVSVLANIPSGPDRDFVFEELARPLPAEPAAEGLLYLSNSRASKGMLRLHPFDSPEGCRQLERWIRSKPDIDSITATEALEFISLPHRADLLRIAGKHKNAEVRMEAARISAKFGDRDALDVLVALCRIPGYAATASEYLRDLQQGHLIPSELENPDSRALAEFARWLAHPNEFGKPPDKMEILDHRELAWPPDWSPTPLWLIRFEMAEDSEWPGGESGVGLVGGVTYCLDGYKMDERPPEDCYAIHCCWEICFGSGVSAKKVEYPSEYAHLLQQYRHAPLEDASVTLILDLADQCFALATARIDDRPGWVVLDEEHSRWYPQADMPDCQWDVPILMLHVGRRLLEL